MVREEEVLGHDASGLAEAIRQRRLTSAAVVEVYLRRIGRLNRSYNAVVTLDEEQARAAAQAADRDLDEGRVRGPLHGVPITIKDALQTAGLRTTAGHEPLSQSVPTEDAPAVARLKDAGAIILGKTNCAKLCSDFQTTNELFGATNNPWHAERTAGGSSGGEAAAVALRLSPLGVGSDTGGSIRIPASYCGVYGFKPSLGKVPTDGLIPPLGDERRRQDSLTVIGPIARSVRDLMLCYDVLSGEASRAEPAWAAPLRVAWTRDFGAQLADDEVTTMLGASLETLARAGARVEAVDSPVDLRQVNFKYLMLNMYEFMPKEANAGFHRLFWMFESIRASFRGGVARSYERLKEYQREEARKLDSFLAPYDCWVIPATPSVAFRHQKSGRPVPIVQKGKVKKRSYWNAVGGFSFFVSLLGNPSVAIPLGLSQQGLPIGAQLIGRRGDDARLLRVARSIAERIGQLRFPAADDPDCTLSPSLASSVARA